MLGGETVYVLSPTSVMDPYSGEATEDWTTPTSVAVAGVLCEFKVSSEPLEAGRDSVTSGIALYMPAGTTITAYNRVRVRGLDYWVIGDPAAWQLGGWAPGLVVQAQRIAG